MIKPLVVAMGLMTACGVWADEDSAHWLSAPLEWGADTAQWIAKPFTEDARTREAEYGDNTEQARNHMYGASQWKLEDDTNTGDRMELRQVTVQDVNTVKLQNVVPPIHFASGRANIPEHYVDMIREVLDGMKDKHNVRLHFIGHTDNAKLSPALREIYGDNTGLSRERAGTTAMFFQRALGLPAESLSFEGLGETVPLATNKTEAGRAKNRRVEVEVWYDELSEHQEEKEVLVAAEMNRIKVCRIETVCKLSYKVGHDKRAKVRNLVVPLHYDATGMDISENFLRQIREAFHNLRGKRNVVARFIGHTDTLPLEGLDARIYGNHLSLSKARARRVALAVREQLGLPSQAVDSDGKGADLPLASNDTEKGRMLNRRVDVEFWYDDPLQALPDEPQLCPEQSGAETVVRAYDPPSGPIAPIYFRDGQPLMSPGYSERLRRLMAEVSDKANVRLRFIGYIANERLTRRTASVYGDDIGLSTARARRVMEQIRGDIALSDEQVEFEGRGYVQAEDVVNAGFVESDSSRVTVEVVYDELALLDDLEGMDITRITREVETQNPFGLNLMRISVDGVPLDDPGKSVADVQRCTDVALDKANIQFKFDNLDFKPRLNVSAWPTHVRYRDDINTSAVENRVRFKLYSNYRSRLEKAEVRLFDAGQSTRAEPLAVIALNADGEGQWQAEFDEFSAPRRTLQYVLRVYDSEGRYDQTQPQSLWVVDEVDSEALAQHDPAKELLVGYGETRLAEQHIPLSGGSIKVYGEAIPDGHTVWVGGRPVPLSDDQQFVVEELLPAGLHTVEVAVLDEEGSGELFLRDLQFKKNDWFGVGIADITAARDSTNGPAKIVTQDDTHYDNSLSLDGRFAFFTTGKFGNSWELTASADTREAPVDELFSNFMDKAPNAMFRRIDPDYYYPTYGDDSKVEEAAPTLGKFYVKVKNHKDYGLWGNFRADYTNNSLVHVDRTLYGANGHLEADDTTSFGDQRFSLDGFVADPGTVASRNEFLGTGGSLYYLRNQDVLQGSERLRVEVRDKDSGLVMAVKNLSAGLDYDIDYIQGRILLSEPLSANYADNMLISSDTGSGNQVFLVARYEYTPGFVELNTMAVGGQGHYWFGDSVRLGLTAHNKEEGDADGSLSGVDITWRKSTATWVKLESSKSSGAGVDTQVTGDGGYNFNPAGVSDTDASAKGLRLDSSLALGELFDGVQGQLTAYLQTLEAGYAAPGLQTDRDVDQYGGTLSVPVQDDIRVRGKLDVKEQNRGLETLAVEVNLDYALSDNWTLSSGVRHDDREDKSPVVPLTQEEGKRTDLRVQAEYDSMQDWSTYGYVQGTAAVNGTRDANNRLGFGGDFRLSDDFTVNGELSGGDLGVLARFGGDYLLSDRTSIYSTYAIENERADNGVRARKGNLVSGLRSRYSDTASMYFEERYSHGEVPSGLTHAAGVDLAPNDRWNYGFNLDVGTLKDYQTAAKTERIAVGGKVGYRLERSTFASALEYRVDDREDPNTAILSERKTWLSKNSLKVLLGDDWRLIGKLNLSESQSSLGEFYDGNFTEAVMGYAYRPVNNDRLNALLKYTYFYNLPATDQMILTNTPAQYVQRSHVMSADVSFDLTSRWSLGAKYAQRRGELSLDRVDPQFFRSDAKLYVLRADWHVLHRWDLLLEARRMDLPQAQDQRQGFLTGIYRHVADHLKVGVGYNSTDFSDDLTDLDFDSKGFFINAIGKF